MGEITINPIHNVHKKYRKMNLVNPYRFTPPVDLSTNTEIGGIAANFPTAPSLASTLGIDVSRITNFTIIGSDIKCRISGAYPLPENCFLNYTNITYFNDIEGLVSHVNQGSFWNASKMTSLTLNGLISTLGEIDRSSNIVFYDFPNCISLATGTFGNKGNKSITVKIPKCTALGASLSDNAVFCKWWGDVKFFITIHVSMQTINGGAPDGDLVGLNPGSVVTYV